MSIQTWSFHHYFHSCKSDLWRLNYNHILSQLNILIFTRMEYTCMYGQMMSVQGIQNSIRFTQANRLIPNLFVCFRVIMYLVIVFSTTVFENTSHLTWKKKMKWITLCEFLCTDGKLKPPIQKLECLPSESKGEKVVKSACRLCLFSESIMPNFLAETGNSPICI